MSTSGDWAAPAGPPPGAKRGWPWIAGAVVVVVAVVVAAVLLMFRDSGDEGAQQQAVSVGVPGQVLLPSMQRQPVVGWRADVATWIPDAPGAAFGVEPVGYSGSRAYFEIYTAEGSPVQRQWVAGLDLDSGASLFTPVELGANSGSNCYVNGPQRLVCTSLFDTAPSLVWVIDSATGAVLANGETDLVSDSSIREAFKLIQVGEYTVAAKKDVGWYGIGDQGQTTWFVPGNGEQNVGRVVAGYYPGDPVSNTAASPGVGNSWTVFSSADGNVLVSDLGAGWVAPLAGGGFAVMDRQSPSGFQMYDARGAKVGEWRPESGSSAEIATGADQLAVVTLGDIGSSDAKQITLTGDGHVMAETNSHSLGEGIRIIGDYLYAATSDDVIEPDTVWSKFDLKTGNPVSSCAALPLSHTDFVGSDGTVVIGTLSKQGHPLDGILRAVDSNTCQTLWQIPNPPAATVMGSTLIQIERSEIASLVSTP